jgi:putative hemolysin
LDIPVINQTIAAINWEVAAVPLIVGFIILVLLLAMSALVSGSEVAFFSLSPIELEELESNKSKTSQIAVGSIG